MGNAKKFLWIIAFLICWQSLAFAQEEVNNTIYFEVLGNAYFYSFNYERKLLSRPKYSISGRVGASYLNIDLLNQGKDAELRFRFFPTTINIVRHFNMNNFEVGIGTVNEISNTETDWFAYKFIPTAHVAYRRYMSYNIDFRGGINFSRADFTPDDNYEVLPWPFISIGRRF